MAWALGLLKLSYAAKPEKHSSLGDVLQCIVRKFNGVGHSEETDEIRQKRWNIITALESEKKAQS